MVTWAQEEDLEDEEEAQVEDGDVDVETDSGESIEVDANVSFQVRYHNTKSKKSCHNGQCSPKKMYIIFL